jgi:ParB-like chromosome segregation protein Spo0J
MSTRQFKALKKSIRRWGFVVPIITNRDYLIADGEHRLTAAKDMVMKQDSSTSPTWATSKPTGSESN